MRKQRRCHQLEVESRKKNWMEDETRMLVIIAAAAAGTEEIEIMHTHETNVGHETSTRFSDGPAECVYVLGIYILANFQMIPVMACEIEWRRSEGERTAFELKINVMVFCLSKHKWEHRRDVDIGDDNDCRIFARAGHTESVVVAMHWGGICAAVTLHSRAHDPHTHSLPIKTHSKWL